jgi:hypothetical protein
VREVVTRVLIVTAARDDDAPEDDPRLQRTRKVDRESERVAIVLRVVRAEQQGSGLVRNLPSADHVPAGAALRG